MFDYRSGAVAGASRNPGTISTAALSGSTVDLASRIGALGVYTFGTTAGTGSVTPAMHESDDDSTWGTVAAGDLIGSFSAVGTTAGNSVQMVGYIGRKRYVRAHFTTSGTPNMPISAAFVNFASGKLPT